MKPVAHPADKALNQRGWKRVQLNNLEGDTRLAGRVVCYNVTPNRAKLLGVIDVNTWRRHNKVYMELVTPNAPPFLNLFVAQGRLGVTPHALGLVACNHTPPRWNPFSLPLVWQQEMNDIPQFNVFLQEYVQMLRDPSWQCPDAADLLR